MTSSILTAASAKALLTSATEGGAPSPISARKHPRTLCLFDVDETLTPARRSVSVEMLNLLAELKREHCAIGFVGGSDLRKITEQLELSGGPKGERRFIRLGGFLLALLTVAERLSRRSERAIRLRLRREWTRGLFTRQRSAANKLHQLDWGRKIPEDRQVLLEIYCGPRHSGDAVRLHESHACFALES